MKKEKILAVVGPTASGKTALAIRLAGELSGEILSCDSMQIYRRMEVGTAKPTAAERALAVHHLLDIAEPDEPFSCADYVAAATRAAEEVLSRANLPIFCGGTGLYLDAFLRGGFEETKTDPAVRERLFAEAERIGDHAMHERLREVDPESAAAIHENNRKRVLRALEIYESTGLTKTETDRRSRELISPYDATVIGLRFCDRALLYRRIDARVDRMIEDGLIEETKRLLADGVFEKNATAAQAIGYKELFAYLRGEEPLSDAVERIKQATRRYAKRQETWFGAKEYVHWIDLDRDGKTRDADEVFDEALRLAQTEF